MEKDSKLCNSNDIKLLSITNFKAIHSGNVMK